MGGMEALDSIQKPADLLGRLRRRADILRAIRTFFDTRDFIEVTTPVRIPAPAPEPHIDCPPCGADFLRASPELQMKKLLAAGCNRIYQIGPCFREGECGSRHNPEFTMIEWYRTNATYLDILKDTQDLLTALIKGSVPTGNEGTVPNSVGSVPTGNEGTVPNSEGSVPTGNERTVPTKIVTIKEMYEKFAGWNPFENWDQDRFDYDMATKIEPNLPQGFVFLMDYPPAAASLSRLRGPVAERWELYYNGLELGNCFTELCDGPEQRTRFAAAKAERRTLGESDYPLDDEFLELLPLIKSAAGVAIGIDRLVMLLCGATDIHEVIVGA